MNWSDLALHAAGVVVLALVLAWALCRDFADRERAFQDREDNEQ